MLWFFLLINVIFITLSICAWSFCLKTVKYHVYDRNTFYLERSVNKQEYASPIKISYQKAKMTKSSWSTTVERRLPCFGLTGCQAYLTKYIYICIFIYIYISKDWMLYIFLTVVFTKIYSRFHQEVWCHLIERDFNKSNFCVCINF